MLYSRTANLVAGVVGVAGENGKSTVNLLGQYNPGELMRQGDTPKGKKQVGALACCRRPPISRPDAEHQPLGTLVSDTAKVRGELLGAVLLAATIQQNGIGRGTAGLAVQPVEDGGLGLEELRVARDISGGPFYIVAQQTVSGLRFGAGTAWGYGSKGDLHIFLPVSFAVLVPGLVVFVTELVDFVPEFSNIS
jgi:hypothetical protein